MKLQTLSGPIPTDDIKLVDAHAHLWINPPKGVRPKLRLVLDDAVRIEAELKDFRSAGGTMLIDCQPGGCGRDARMLKKLGEAAEVYVTATTGFHLKRYYPDEYWLWTASEQAAVDYFVNELRSGLQEADDLLATTIKVGHDGKIEAQTQILMEAAAEAARQTGVALLFHTEEGRNVEALPVFFEDRGIPTNRLYLCHMDKRPDFGLHRELARAGALLGYDTFVRPKYEPRQYAWPLLVEMVNNELDDHIAIGLDLARNSMWRHYGGQPGLVSLPDRILPRLYNEGWSETVVAKLVGQNVAQFLVRKEG